MKKNIIIITVLAVCALLVAACAEIVLPLGLQPGKKYKFIDVNLNVNLGDATKTSISETGNHGLLSKWKAGDVLYAYAEDLGFVGKVICAGGEISRGGVSTALFSGRLAIPEDFLSRRGSYYDSDSGSGSEEEGLSVIFIYPGSEDFIGNNSQPVSFDHYIQEEYDRKEHTEGTYSILDLSYVESVSELSKYDIAGAYCVLSPDANGVYSGFAHMKNVISFLKISTLGMTKDITLNGLNNALLFSSVMDQTIRISDGTRYDQDYPDYVILALSAIQPTTPIKIPAGKSVLYLPVVSAMELSNSFDGLFGENNYGYSEYYNDQLYTYVRGFNEDGEVWGIRRFKTETPGKIYMNPDGTPIALQQLTSGDMNIAVGYENNDRISDTKDVYFN